MTENTPLIETARRAATDLVGWRIDRLQADLAGPLSIVGAGGSRPVARLWAALHLSAGHAAWTLSPLELLTCPPPAPVLILSASGRHHDILGAAEAALGSGRPVHAVTTDPEAPLIARLRAADPHHHTVALTGPTVREGLAARHGSIPMALLAGWVHGVTGVEAFAEVPADRAPSEALVAGIPSDIVVLGAGLARPAAEAFAHLMRESGLAPARADDPREFAHGQFVAVGARTRIVVFGLTAQRWLGRFVDALPPELAPLVVIDDRAGAEGAVALYARAVHAAGVAIQAAGANPGREAIPGWGAALYRMPVDTPKDGA